MNSPREYLQRAAPEFVRDSLPDGVGVMPIAAAEAAVAQALADADAARRRYVALLVRALLRGWAGAN